MRDKFPQGRIKVIQTSPSCLEWVYSWPKSENYANEDARLLLNMAIVWHYLENNVDNQLTWSIEMVEAAIPSWLDLETNFTLNPMVKSFSKIMLKSLLEHFWKTNLQISIIRNFEKLLNKAAIDIESSKVAGFLKLSVITTTVRPELLSFNGFTRKIPASHYACNVFLVIRNKATSNDVSNYYTMKSHLENKVKIYCNIDSITVKISVNYLYGPYNIYSMYRSLNVVGFGRN